MSSLVVPFPISDMIDGSPDYNGTATVLGVAPSSSVYTLAANLFADVVTIRSGIRVAAGQYVIVCRRLVIESGAFLSANGNNASGITAGAAITSAGYTGWAAGAGGAGVSVSTVSSANGNNGSGSGGANVAGTGGNGGTGGTGAAGTGNASVAATINQFRFWRSAGFASVGWKMPPTSTGTTWTLINGGGGGGSGGVQVTATGGNALASGAGGGGGGLLYFACGVLQNNGTIEASGGNGGNAAIGAGVTGFGGGGGGGAGGAIHASVQQIASLGTFNVSGGTGGTGIGGGITAPGVNGTVGTLALFVRGEAI